MERPAISDVTARTPGGRGSGSGNGSDRIRGGAPPPPAAAAETPAVASGSALFASPSPFPAADLAGRNAMAMTPAISPETEATDAPAPSFSNTSTTSPRSTHTGISTPPASSADDAYIRSMGNKSDTSGGGSQLWAATADNTGERSGHDGMASSNQRHSYGYGYGYSELDDGDNTTSPATSGGEEDQSGDQSRVIYREMVKISFAIRHVLGGAVQEIFSHADSCSEQEADHRRICNLLGDWVQHALDDLFPQFSNASMAYIFRQLTERQKKEIEAGVIQDLREMGPAEILEEYLPSNLIMLEESGAGRRLSLERYESPVRSDQSPAQSRASSPGTPSTSGTALTLGDISAEAEAKIRAEEKAQMEGELKKARADAAKKEDEAAALQREIKELKEKLEMTAATEQDPGGLEADTSQRAKFLSLLTPDDSQVSDIRTCK